MRDLWNFKVCHGIYELLVQVVHVVVVVGVVAVIDVVSTNIHCTPAYIGLYQVYVADIDVDNISIT